MIPSLVRYAGAEGSQAFKRAQTGLFGGAMKQYGNNVPHSKTKTRRTWLPNIQPKKLYSETLQRHIQTKITARTLKTVDKYGGLDAYLLNTKIKNLGDEGLRLRELVLNRKEQVLKQSQESGAIAS
ncbi:39S ribosomal protein L24, mitochondrial [Tulasnella sp. 418]|nr:39S ribosomal protein L24, mitochondrial [Tulasnella sp. 418]